MLIPTVGGGKQRMALFIMQQHQRPASQDRPQSSNQSSGNTGICVDGLAVPIDVAGQSTLRFGGVVERMPELCRPLGQGIGQSLCPTSMGHLRQKGFGVAIAIGSLMPSK